MIDFTLYPNLNGQLGQNKVQIPDSVTTLWPDGDALVENFIYKDGKLVGLVDTKALIENDSKTTVFPYDYVDITLDKRLESLMTFNAGERCKHLNVKYDIFLPKGYKRLEYLESTGTQWIDTGIKLSNESEVRVTLYTEENDEHKSQSPYGWAGDTSKQFYCFSQFYYEPSQKYMSLFYLPKNFVASKARVIGKCDIIHNAEGFTVNGIKTSRTTEFDPFETPSNCRVFSKAGGANFLGCIYSFSISRNDQLQLNLIPCLDDTGAPCMYDIISREPFRNDGTGDFLYPGAESQVVTSSIDDKFYAKMTEHGIQRLYKTPDDYSGTKDDYASEYGFKEIVEPPMPTDGHWSPQWTETDNQLICNWVEAEEMEIL